MFRINKTMNYDKIKMKIRQKMFEYSDVKQLQARRIIKMCKNRTNKGDSIESINRHLFRTL